MDRDMITITSLKDAGYTIIGIHNEIIHYEKIIKDNIGIKYIIKFKIREYIVDGNSQYIYEPEVGFFDSNCRASISVFMWQSCLALDNINSLEMFIEKIWYSMKFGYYKKNN
jgi:hypothetical protein